MMLHNSQRLKNATITNNYSVWTAFPGELWETALSFLSFNDLGNIRSVTRQMSTFAYLAGFFQQISFHFQTTKKYTLAKYLFSNMQSEQGELDISQIVAYFQERYRENFVNLLVDYDTILPKFFPKSKWVCSSKEVEKKFYPEVNRGGLALECESLVSLAKQVLPSYQIIFGKHNSGVDGVQKMASLPPKLSLADYNKVLEFLDRVGFVEQLWADITLLHGIFGEVEFLGITDLTQRIFDFFDNTVITENITSLPLIVISTLDSCNFDVKLLATNPILFHYFNRLLPDELVFVINQASVVDDVYLHFLEAVIRLPEVRKRLLGSHYINMSAHLLKINEDEGVDSKKAAIILSIPEIIGQLTDKHLLRLMERLWKEVPELLRDNMALKDRMTGDLWIDLVKACYFFAKVVSKDKAVYDLLSAQQLKYLVQEMSQHELLEDGDVFAKLDGAFNAREVKILAFNNPSSFIKKVSMLVPKNSHTSCSISSTYYVSSRHDHVVMNRGVESDRITGINNSSVGSDFLQNKLNSNESNDFINVMECVFAGANILLLMGAATGIATFLLPEMLSVAIGFLGAALLAYSAYGLMANSRYGFFSASNSSAAGSLSLQKIDFNEERHAHWGKP
jgi:hypothetical protein